VGCDDKNSCFSTSGDNHSIVGEGKSEKFLRGDKKRERDKKLSMSGDDRNFEFFILSSQPLQIVDTSDSSNGNFMGFFLG
jgi:hypothetical protein